MKKLLYIYFIPLCLSLSVFIACKKSFLDKQPQGPLSGSVLANKKGVQGLLIGAYAFLDGVGGVGQPWEQWYQPISNWPYGSVASDESHKGTEYGDQAPLELIENYTADATNPYFNGKWSALYGGIQRANDVIRLIAKVKDGSLSDVEKTELKAEAVFIRAVLHFEAAKMWKNVPYVDETISFANGNYDVSNEAPVYPKIEADFKFAIASLNATQPQIGRANSWAAKAFLAKVYMFEHKYVEAKAVLDDVIANGVTSAGQHYALLDNYADNFNPGKKNGPESVFAIQMSVNDNASGYNGNIGDMGNFPQAGPASCCSFNQPSFSLVNSYKTDAATGLPLIESWNNGDIKNDMGVSGTDSFTPYSGTVDPRLDWTVGRRGIPYLDWGLMPGKPWIRSQEAAGPYSPKKSVYYKYARNTTSDTYEGWAAGNSTANNYNMIRFADVLLWAAEAEVEVGSLQQAEIYVNMVRNRAANASGFVYKYIDDSDPLKGYTSTPAANYKVGLYNGAFTSKEFAREAVRFERKLELGMEGHRFFDLQRWDNGAGYMADVLNKYIEHETSTYDYKILKGATFTKGKNEYFPIPQAQIDLSKENGIATLKQNAGYN